MKEIDITDLTHAAATLQEELLLLCVFICVLMLGVAIVGAVLSLVIAALKDRYPFFRGF